LRALEAIYSRNMPHTFEFIRDLAPQMSMSLTSFRDGFRAAANDDDEMTRRDLDNARNVFKRMAEQDQGPALEFLFAGNNPLTFEWLADAVKPGVQLSLEAFKNGARAAADDSAGMTQRDLDNARRFFRLMSPDDRAEAMTWLLTDGRERTFAAVKDLV
jgi:hypothetical protein